VGFHVRHEPVASSPFFWQAVCKPSSLLIEYAPSNRSDLGSLSPIHRLFSSAFKRVKPFPVTSRALFSISRLVGKTHVPLPGAMPPKRGPVKLPVPRSGNWHLSLFIMPFLGLSPCHCVSGDDYLLFLRWLGTRKSEEGSSFRLSVRYWFLFQPLVDCSRSWRLPPPPSCLPIDWGRTRSPERHPSLPCFSERPPSTSRQSIFFSFSRSTMLMLVEPPPVLPNTFPL